MRSCRRFLPANRRTVFVLKTSLRGLLARFLSTGMVFLPLFLLFPTVKPLASQKLEAKRGNKRIKIIVDRLRQDLSIQEDVLISVVSDNKRLVSVERSKKQRSAFVLSVDEKFLSTLNDTELTAAIAHELGHVWIFTHHPYLQTELLANQIALKVVTQRVWKRFTKKFGRTKGLRAI